MVGVVFTQTVLVVNDEQPEAVAPKSVQVVVVIGLTTLVPDEYVYDAAPLGVMVNAFPEQMVPLLTEIVGVDVIEMVVTADDKQPAKLAPVTVQLVVSVGFTTAEPEEKE